jgi:hypothetical protein
MRLRDRRLVLLTGSAALLAPFPSAQQPFGPGLTPADLVAELQLEAPNATRFVLRGNVPIPRGTHFPGGAQFAQVIDQDGTWPADTQIDVVTRNAGTGGTGGSASVVQFSALVNRDPAVSPGTLLNYQIVPVAGAVPAGYGTPDVMDLANGPRDVPAPIQALVLDPQSIVIRGETITSTGASLLYYAYPLQGTADLRIERYGPAMTTLRSFRVMEPAAPLPNAYPHLFGVHAYFTTMAEQPYVTMELRFSNGAEGGDTSNLLDDQLAEIHWKRIDLLLPSDACAWTPAVDFLDPYSAQPGHPTAPRSSTTCSRRSGMPTRPRSILCSSTA